MNDPHTPSTVKKRLYHRDEVVRTFRLLVGDGHVTELRALEAQRQEDFRPGTLSGYFDNAEALAAAVGTIKTAKGIYVIPNAINPALLARSANRIKQAHKDDGTQNGDIARRRWLLIDCDPVRPTGISSTEAEHAAALRRVQDIAAHLTAAGWPDPIIADSGNGAHLLYRIDLPAEDGGIVQRCLQALAAGFDDEAVTVDTSVHNPARIWKLYGTMSCKGDNVPDRPWRMSRIIDAPTDPRQVSIELLQALAAEIPMPTRSSSAPCHETAAGESFDIDGFIQRHGLDVDGPHSWNGQQGPGRRWTLTHSPMCDHHDGAAHLEQHASGAITAGCHHNSCSWTWQDLRARFEPRPERAAGIMGIVRTTSANPETPWPELDRLDVRTLPAFPLQALPEALREWVAAESKATQTPADLAALLALAVCSSCIAGRVEIEPHPRWREPTNVYVAVLLDPGNRKSAVFNDATHPLREAERTLIEEARPAVARAQSQRRQVQRRLDRCEKLAAEKGDAAAAAEALQLAEELATHPESVLPRLIVDNVTGEKLEIVLAEQDGRLASLSPEGGVFDLMAGRYSRNGAPDFEVYLKAHAGDEIRTDRVSRKGVHIKKPALTCAYAIQPVVIAGIAGDATFRGRGLLARFLYAAPKSWIGEREICPDPVPPAVAEAYADLVYQLATDPPKGTLTLAPDAANFFQQWQAEIEAMLAEFGPLEAIRDWGAKLAGATARLAAVLHCVQHPDDAMDLRIDADTIRAAIEIARYLIPHATSVLTLMHAQQGGSADDACYLQRWIRRHGQPQFTKRQAHQDCKRRFPQADDIDPVLNELMRRGYIRPKPQDAGGPGRRPSPVYEVNPAVFDAGNAENRPHNPQNSSTPSPEGVSGDSEGASHQSENASDAPDAEGDDWGEL